MAIFAFLVCLFPFLCSVFFFFFDSAFKLGALLPVVDLQIMYSDGFVGFLTLTADAVVLRADISHFPFLTMIFMLFSNIS